MVCIYIHTKSSLQSIDQIHTVCDFSKFSIRECYLLHVNREDFKIEVTVSNFMKNQKVEKVDEEDLLSAENIQSI